MTDRTEWQVSRVRFDSFRQNYNKVLGTIVFMLRKALKERFGWTEVEIDQRLDQLRERSVADIDFNSDDGLEILGLILAINEMVQLGECAMGMFNPQVFDRLQVLNERLFQTAASLTGHVGITFKATADYADKFRTGSKKERTNALKEVMIELVNGFLAKNGRLPSTKELWVVMEGVHLAQGEEAKCIQEIDGFDHIYWRGVSGSEHTTAFKTFQNRLSEIKKAYK